MRSQAAEGFSGSCQALETRPVEVSRFNACRPRDFSPNGFYLKSIVPIAPCSHLIVRCSATNEQRSCALSRTAAQLDLPGPLAGLAEQVALGARGRLFSRATLALRDGRAEISKL